MGGARFHEPRAVTFHLPAVGCQEPRHTPNRSHPMPVLYSTALRLHQYQVNCTVLYTAPRMYCSIVRCQLGSSQALFLPGQLTDIFFLFPFSQVLYSTVPPPLQPVLGCVGGAYSQSGKKEICEQPRRRGRVPARLLGRFSPTSLYLEIAPLRRRGCFPAGGNPRAPPHPPPPFPTRPVTAPPASIAGQIGGPSIGPCARAPVQAVRWRGGGCSRRRFQLG